MATFPALGTIPQAVRTALLRLHERITALESTPGGVTDHGALAGLGDNDHPHYALVSSLGALATLNEVGSAQITNGSIVNDDISAGAGIVDTKLAQIATADKVSVAALDIDGATDIGGALADADLIVVDDGAGGTNRKSALSRVATWLFAKVSGDATASSGGALTIANNAVSNAKAADMATQTFKGRTTAGTGDPEDLTATQATAMLNTFTSSLKGLAPSSGGGTSNFLRADGTWAAPSATATAIYNANTGDVTASAADTYVTGSALSIGGRVKAGTILRWRLVMTKTAAGTATPVVNFRFGTAGTTADTARASFTGVAQTAATDTAWMDVMVIVRNAGATGFILASMSFGHFNTTTGFANKAQAQVFQGQSGAFDLTGGTLIAGLSVNPGASGVWTIQSVSAEAVNLN